MKKIVTLVLALVFILTSVIPTFGNNSTKWIQNKLVNSVTLTAKKVGDGFVAEKNYFEEFKKSLETFYENYSSGNNTKFTGNLNYSSYGEEVNGKIYLEMNDDGKSLAVNFQVTLGANENVSGKIFVNDNLAIIDIPEVIGEKLVYYFNENDLKYESQIYNCFKYSSIKSYYSNFTDLSKRKEIEDINKAYLDNLFEYILKGNMSIEGDIITLNISGSLIRTYLEQLAYKIRNDENLKTFFKNNNSIDYLILNNFSPEEFNLEYDGSEASLNPDELEKTIIDEMFNKIADNLLEYVKFIDNKFAVVYEGKLSNNLLLENKIDFKYDNREYCNIKINFEEKDEKVLFTNADVIFKSEEYGNLFYDLSYNKIDNGSNFILSYYKDNKLLMNYSFDLITSENELKIDAIIRGYTDVSYNVSEPYKPEMESLEEFFEWYYMDLDYLKNTIELHNEVLEEQRELLNSEIEISKKHLKVNDKEEFLPNKSMLMLYSSGFLKSEKLDIEDYIDGLEELNNINERQFAFYSELENSINTNTAKEPNDVTDIYETYKEIFYDQYNYDMKQYNKFLEISSSDAINEVFIVEYLMEEKLTPTSYLLTMPKMRFITDFYYNEIVGNVDFDFNIKTEVEPNNYNLSNATNLLEYIGKLGY